MEGGREGMEGERERGGRKREGREGERGMEEGGREGRERGKGEGDKYFYLYPDLSNFFIYSTDFCLAGHFSSNGLLPCQPCAPNYYQLERGATDCLPCTNTTSPEICPRESC